MRSLSGLDEQDQAALEKAYGRLPHDKRIPGATPQDATDIAANRAIIEACVYGNKTDGRSAILRLLDDETHYEMERRGLRWNERAGHFEQPDGRPAEIYHEVRRLVIGALAERIGDYFQGCTVHRRMPRHGAREDFRMTLERYIAALDLPEPVILPMPRREAEQETPPEVFVPGRAA